jgi:O-antigen/teichoic acid export membrane protein
VVYGDKYLGAVPVLIVAAILGIFRAFQEIPDTLLRAADQQRDLLTWMGITGAVNLLLDWLLIPHYGAVGAAWGNGLGQAFGVIAIWMQARRFYRFGLPLGPTPPALWPPPHMKSRITSTARPRWSHPSPSQSRSTSCS